MSTLEPGERRARLVYQTSTPTTAADGQQTPAWSDAFRVSGRLRELAGRELFYARQMLSTASHEVRTRWRGDIDPGGRFRIEGGGGGRVLQILAASDPDGRRMDLVVMCLETKPPL
jgi:SPP1 family predicted phage head-tail adaptor